MRVFIIGLFVVMFITGCESNTVKKNNEVPKSNENLPQLRAELEREYAAWKSLEIQNYEFTFEIGDVGLINKVTVKNGSYFSAIDIIRPEVPCTPQFETIDALFDHIARSFLYDEQKIFSPGQIGTYFSLRYDLEYHYPVKYDTSNIYDKNKGYLVGNGITIWVFDFTLLEE